jgi:uncharacterized protein YecE (DUF72 family)
MLAEAGESVQRFVGQGMVELGDKLGPLLWQFMATKKFDAAISRRFSRPAAAQPGRRRAAPRRAGTARQLPRARIRRDVPQGGVAIVYADSPQYPAIADISADFVYARLENAGEEITRSGYPRGRFPIAGRRRRRLGGRRAARGLPYVERRRRPHRARPSSSSSMAPRCARRRRRRR